MIGAAREQEFADPIFHVHYLDLVSNPVATATALYRHFGEVMTPVAAARMSRMVEAKPNGGYRAHGSRLEEYGLDAGLERERYARYMAHFGIRAELGPMQIRNLRATLVGANANPAPPSGRQNPLFVPHVIDAN